MKKRLNISVIALSLVYIAYSHAAIIDPIHGTSYRIQSVAHDAYLSASSHIPRAGSGLIYGSVAGDYWHGSPNQIWDAIAFKTENGTAFWFFPKAAVGNELSYIPEDIDIKNLHENNNNLFKVETVTNTAKGKKRVVSLESIYYGKCLTSRDFNPATYEICDPTKRSQQWTFDVIRETPNAEETNFQHRDRFGNYYLQKKTALY